MSNRFIVEVKGVDDATLAADIEQTIRTFLAERALPGSWKVIVKPSRIGGRWDFQVYGLDVRHTLSISVPPARLTSFIPVRLRESLDRCVTSRVPRSGARLRELAEAV